MQDFEELLKSNQVLHPCVVVGDMKKDLMKQNAIPKAYLNMSLSIGFKQMVTQSTKITVRSESCKDHVLTKGHNKITRVLKRDISHQFGVFYENFFCRDKNRKERALNFP